MMTYSLVRSGPQNQIGDQWTPKGREEYLQQGGPPSSGPEECHVLVYTVDKLSNDKSVREPDEFN